MKQFFGALALLLVGMCATVAWAGHHIDGTWKLGVTLGGQATGTATFDLTEDEDGQLTGTYTGGAGTADVTGTADGNAVEFSFDSQAGKVTYKGTVDGDAMSGTCVYGMLGEGTFEGTRAGS